VAGLFQTPTPPAFALLCLECGGEAVNTRYFLRGEVDVSNADEQFALMYASSWLHSGDVIIDCSGLRFIDAAGLHSLIAIRDELREQGRNLSLVHAPAFLFRVLVACGRTELLAPAPDRVSRAAPLRGLTAAAGLPARNN
jgi:anti-anti-sigma factor